MQWGNRTERGGLQGGTRRPRLDPDLGQVCPGKRRASARASARVSASPREWLPGARGPPPPTGRCADPGRLGPGPRRRRLPRSMNPEMCNFSRRTSPPPPPARVSYQPMNELASPALYFFKVAFSTFQFKFGATLRRQAERSDSEARHKAPNLT